MIGIIGFGRFGKLTARYLAEDFEVLVFNRTDKSAEIEKAGARKASLKRVCQQKIVILCVPISTLKEVLAEIGPVLAAGVLPPVLDGGLGSQRLPAGRLANGVLYDDPYGRV